MKTVILLTAGTGSRMGRLSTVINKTLLPIKDKAIISHIIEQFENDTRFIVAVGNGASDVKDYLTFAYPDTNFEFCRVPDFAGPTAGPAKSILSCRDSVGSDEFYIIACDGYYENISSIPTDGNYISVCKVDESETASYCNVKLDDAQNITAVIDKKFCDDGFAVSGVFYIKDTKTFWDNIHGQELSSGWAALDAKGVIIPWVDLGTYDRYISFVEKTSAYDNSKIGEFIYLVNGRVVKWFSDATVTQNRLARLRQNKAVFPEIENYSDNWYSYKFVEGDVLYKSLTPETFRAFIDFMGYNVWHQADIVLDQKLCTIFYFNKTMSRLDAFRKKYPTFNPRKINGVDISIDLDTCIKSLDWDRITSDSLPERSVFFHGDCQFDNIIFNKGQFTLIDWRQDFAGQIDVGDLYYDIAKMFGGLIINYDLVRQHKFDLVESDNGKCVEYRLESKTDYSCFVDILREEMPHLVDGGKLLPVIEDLITLIFLNMSPLHHSPFDKLLYCIVLERLNRQFAG